MSRNEIRTGVIAMVDVILLLLIAMLGQQILEMKHMQKQQWINQHSINDTVQVQIHTLNAQIIDNGKESK